MDSLRNVTCPHLLTLNFRQEVTGNFEHDNNRKITDLTKTVGSPMALFVPTAKEELAERQELQKGVSDKEFTISSMVLTLTLFTDKKQQRRDTQAAKEAFGACGLDLKPQVMLQSQCLLASMPFMMGEGLRRRGARPVAEKLQSGEFLSGGAGCTTTHRRPVTAHHARTNLVFRPV